MRLADYFDAAAEQYPQSLAFVDGATRVNLDQAQKTVHAMANALVRAKADRCRQPRGYLQP